VSQAFITVEDDIFDRFMGACKKAQNPNAALREAVAYTKKQGIKCPTLTGIFP